MHSLRKIIGIDPGLAATGFGVVEGTDRKVDDYSFGTIRTPKSENLACRLNRIFSQLRTILNSEKPNLIVIEGIFSLKQYPKSGIVLGKVCGVVHVAGAQCDIPTIELPAREVKRILTGNGGAGKSQMEQTVRHLLKRKAPISPSHASDALALALVGLSRYQ